MLVEDQGSAVRAGEELDTQRVSEWLRSQGVSVQGAPVLTQFSGGASNWTYRLQYPDHDLILRRPPAGTKAKSAHDMGREYRVQSALKPVYAKVPTMIGLCTDPSILGVDFYVMERISGVIPRRSGLGLALNPAQTRTLCFKVFDELLALHRIDASAIGLSSLGKGDGYVQRQVSGWCDRYQKARTPNVPSFQRVMDWLKTHAPHDVAQVIIHNDWRLDNVILSKEAEVIGVLDWEMATIGDPLMDLGSALAYWVEADDGYFMKMTQRQPSFLPGMLKRQEIVDYYLQQSGLQPQAWAFYEVFGLFRLAGIIQQIYYRYFHGQTNNPAFKKMWMLVNYFDWRCKALIRHSGKR